MSKPGRVKPVNVQKGKPVALTRRKHGTKKAKALSNALAMSQLSLGNH